MIKQLYRKNTAASAVRNVNDLLPWHMYVVNKDKQFRMFNEDEDDEDEDEENRTTDTARMILSNDFNMDALVDADLDIDTKEIDAPDFDWIVIDRMGWDSKCGNRIVPIHVHGYNIKGL